MAGFLEIPQTPRAKTRIDDEAELDTIDGPPGRKSDASSFFDPDAFRQLSLSPASDRGRISPGAHHVRNHAAAPAGLLTWRSSIKRACARFWQRNKYMVLVFLAQVFGALMNLAARLLELEGKGMHPFQLLFARMSLTTVMSCGYMYWKKVPDAPLGAKDVRWLLVVRGLSGFFGIFGMWYSMMYLPLAEATVISFLAPSVSGYICHLTLHDPFTRKEQVSSFLALAGVILIARPTALFSSSPASPVTAAPVDIVANMTEAHRPHFGEEATPSQRLWAIGVALLGVFGGSGAFTTIRAIGNRAHPLVSVNYFSTWCTIVTTVTLAFAPLLNFGQPGLRFGFPDNLRQWGLLLFICLCGFLTQYLVTAGLGGERSNRATAMVYTHMLFAAGFDKWVFGHEMDKVSLGGCGLIIGSAVWVALSKKPVLEVPGGDVEVGQVMRPESIPMLAREDSEDEDEEIG